MSRQTWCNLQVKLCDERFVGVVSAKIALYKYTSFPFLSFSFPLGYTNVTDDTRQTTNDRQADLR